MLIPARLDAAARAAEESVSGLGVAIHESSVSLGFDIVITSRCGCENGAYLTRTAIEGTAVGELTSMIVERSCTRHPHADPSFENPLSWRLDRSFPRRQRATFRRFLLEAAPLPVPASSVWTEAPGNQ